MYLPYRLLQTEFSLCFRESIISLWAYSKRGTGQGICFLFEERTGKGTENARGNQ
jgi:hypothetical protein